MTWLLDTGLSCFRKRRERDLNPRMAVLQTAALDHLAIPPYGLRTATYPTHVTLSSVNFLILSYRNRTHCLKNKVTEGSPKTGKENFLNA